MNLKPFNFYQTVNRDCVAAEKTHHMFKLIPRFFTRYVFVIHYVKLHAQLDQDNRTLNNPVARSDDDNAMNMKQEMSTVEASFAI